MSPVLQHPDRTRDICQAITIRRRSPDRVPRSFPDASLCRDIAGITGDSNADTIPLAGVMLLHSEGTCRVRGGRSRRRVMSENIDAAMQVIFEAVNVVAHVRPEGGESVCRRNRKRLGGFWHQGTGDTDHRSWLFIRPILSGTSVGENKTQCRHWRAHGNGMWALGTDRILDHKSSVRTPSSPDFVQAPVHLFQRAHALAGSVAWCYR